MKVILDKKESEKFFHSALCNHFGVGSYGLEFHYTEKAYKNAKKTLAEKIKAGKAPHTMMVSGNETPTICREDVWMEILSNGDKLKVIDHEGEGAHTRSITLKDVHDRVSKTPIQHLTNMIEGNDDADTADVIFQTVFFEDIIFG